MEIENAVSRVVEPTTDHCLVLRVRLVQLELFGVEPDLVVELNKVLQSRLGLVLGRIPAEPELEW